MNKSLCLSMLAAALALLGGCANPERSRDLANPSVAGITLARQVCSNCHGVTGNAVSPNFPNLAGQTVAYTTAQLQAFKSHNRSDPGGFEYMWGLSRSLTDAQIQALAEYYATQQPQAQPPESPAELAAAGKRLFEAGIPDKGVPGCGACHGAQAQGNANFPRLAGQHADYLRKQLTVFQRTDERPEGSVMKTIAHGLNGQDIVELAAYLQTL